MNMPHQVLLEMFEWKLTQGHSSWSADSAVELSSPGDQVKSVSEVHSLVHCYQCVHCN